MPIKPLMMHLYQEALLDAEAVQKVFASLCANFLFLHIRKMCLSLGLNSLVIQS